MNSLSFFFIRNKAIIIIILFFVSCNRDYIKFENGNVIEAFRKSSTSNKKIFVLFVDKDCGNCQSFESFLNNQYRTVDILNSEYLNYKIDITDSSVNELAKIMKIPTVPFPYFFDSYGELEAFGFPDEKEYDINDLQKITIKQKIFSEIFRLPVQVIDYKKMVSHSLKALISLKSKDSLMAKSHILSSLNISHYPYNIRFYNKYFSTPTTKSSKGEYALSRSDERLYGNINDYMLLSEKPFDLVQINQNKEQYVLSNHELDLGKIQIRKDYNFDFRIISNSDTPLYITDVNHPCSCISLTWPKKPVRKNESILIRGEFQPDNRGKFIKEIYIHTRNQKKVGIFYLKGEII